MTPWLLEPHFRVDGVLTVPVRSGVDTTWFGGDGPRDAAEARFLDRLREEASSWGVPGLNPDCTRTLARIVPLLLTVEVPGLARETSSSHRLTQLQVGYWQRGPYGHGLEGECGCDSLLDNHRYDTDGLTVIGIDAEPEDFTSWAADWLRRQLSRPANAKSGFARAKCSPLALDSPTAG